MVSKDQAIGGVIFIVCAVAGLFYVVTLLYPQWLGYFNLKDTGSIQFWIVAVPVLVAFIAIMGIGAWIAGQWQRHRHQNQLKKSQAKWKQKKRKLKINC